jgi:hypothetical protein
MALAAIGCGSSSHAGEADASADHHTSSVDAAMADHATHDAGVDHKTSTPDAYVGADAGTDTGTSPAHDAGDGLGIPPSPVQAGTSLACTKNIGTGSGTLNYPTLQSTLTLAAGDVVCIAAGTYSGASFAGATATGNPITIQNAPGATVTFDGTVSFSNLHNVVFSGAGTTGQLTGITLNGAGINDNVDITGPLDTFTFQNVSLVQGDRYGVYVNDDTLVYQAGNPASYFHDLTFKNLSIQSQAGSGAYYTFAFGPTSAGLTAAHAFISITENLEIAHCDIGNIVPGIVMSLGDVQGAKIHHNRFLNINVGDTDHDALILLAGYGDIYDNYARIYHGEGARLWPFGISAPVTLNVYNNINLGSIKYSAIEFQPNCPELNVLSLVPPAGLGATLNAYNNTAGELATVAEGNPSLCGDVSLSATPGWYSGVIDTYDTVEAGAYVKLTNNLVFASYCPYDNGQAQATPQSFGGHLINFEGNLAPDFKTNAYYASSVDAGLLDDKGVTPVGSSPVVGQGTALPGLTTDFYGNPRHAPPSIGAVE